MDFLLGSAQEDWEKALDFLNAFLKKAQDHFFYYGPKFAYNVKLTAQGWMPCPYLGAECLSLSYIAMAIEMLTDEQWDLFLREELPTRERELRDAERKGGY